MAATPTPPPSPAKPTQPTPTPTPEPTPAPLTSVTSPSNESPLSISSEVSQPVLQPEPPTAETVDVPEAQDTSQVSPVETEIPVAEIVTPDAVSDPAKQELTPPVATQLVEQVLPDLDPVTSLVLEPQPLEQPVPITPDAVTSFSPRDLRQVTVEEYQLFSADHITGLKPRAMKGLRKSHMVNTTVDQLSYFSDAQLRFVKGKRYQLVSLDQFTVIEPLLPSLKAKQLKRLPDYPITQEVLELMSNKQLAALDLF